MGVDCRVTLPADVRMTQVADAIGIAAGLTWRWEPLGSTGSKHIVVEGLSTKPSAVAGLAEIHLHGETVDGQRDHFLCYHFEFGTRGTRGIMPRATPFWIAVMRRVVDCFGGTLDYQDSDVRSLDYVVRPTGGWMDESDEAFDRNQQRLAAIVPVSKAEIDAFAGVAAY